MFKRRNKLSLGQKIACWLWPKTGLGRAWQYLLYRLARMPGSSYSIAAGFACGAAASFTPFVGLHFVLAAIVTWLIRANVLASAIGTAVGNPWTFPFIWIWLYETGKWMLSGTMEDLENLPDFYATFSDLMEKAMRFDVAGFLDAAIPVFWPMFISGIPSAIVVWLVIFFSIRKLVRGYQRRRRRKMKEIRARRRDNADTGIQTP